MPAGVHNGKRIQGAKRSRIIEAIAQGECVAAICRRFRMSPRSVIAVREAEWQKVANRKEVLAAQSEAIANESGDQLLQALQERKIPVGQLYKNWGTSIDKSLALRGDSLGTVRHIHSIDITQDDMIAFAVALSPKQNPQRRTTESNKRNRHRRVRSRPQKITPAGEQTAKEGG